ncbi:MAG TPA: undecaprenyl/decaprenyl-phosphate alpha-N-acetylglucosaminyl 1-phosphate transferase [Desulfuromonadales bacterium]|nr:undecaprenyl/decaprenyl-phosphate alpha-N-acetylglucosaminyl 1-phosphate transferase [Desulfuromonadales bacterium]
MIFLSTLLLALLITIAMTPLLSMLAVHFKVAVDLPGERKVHTLPVPRIGGIAMTVGAFVPLLYWLHADHFVTAYLAAATILVAFGMLDDALDIPPRFKFLGQIIAALVIILAGDVQIRSLGMLLPDGFLLPGFIALPLTLLAIVGATNAINLSDGLDGLAGGICLLIFASIGCLAYLEGNQTIGLIALALSGVLFGFLRFNTHPASIFMGDAGSQFLGFSAASLSISLTQATPTLSPVLPLILLGFPVLDTLTVMITRISKGISPFSADKNHFHHHLMSLGLHHAESVVVIYVFQTLLIISALLFRYQSDWLLLVEYLGFSAAVLLFFHWARKKEWRAHHFDFFEVRIAGRFRLLKREGTAIKRTFPVFVYGISILLFSICFMARDVPHYLKIAAVPLLVTIGLIWLFARQWLGRTLRMTIYLFVPFAVYLSETAPNRWLNGTPHTLYNSLFGIFAVLILVISKFSRRTSGFKSSPMDFLIIILAVAVPNLPNNSVLDYQYGLVAAKVIMLYFSFEVLLTELRGKYTVIAGTIMLSLLVLITR